MKAPSARGILQKRTVFSEHTEKEKKRRKRKKEKLEGEG
jgi:hypothetical protein